MKRIAALALVIILSFSGFSAFAGGSTVITVSLRVEGADRNLFYNPKAYVTAGGAGYGLSDYLGGIGGLPEITFDSVEEEAYLLETDEVSEYVGSNWRLRVNDAERLPEEYLFTDGDEIIVYFADTAGESFQYPVADAARLMTYGIIRFTSEDIEYDEDLNPIVSVNPVVGAAVTYNGEYSVTNEKGEIFIGPADRLAGAYDLEIERYDEQSGMPTVLRFAPDYKLYVPFTDTPSGAWYYNAVEFAVREGYFKGVGDNKFAPEARLTIEQLLSVLARIDGGASDIDPNIWYLGALKWAVDSGIIAEDEFILGESVTREKFIYMFYLTAMRSDDRDTTLRADITDAADYEGISQEYREAISWAAAAGLIRGTDGDKFTVDPQTEISRAVLCQMLYNYYY